MIGLSAAGIFLVTQGCRSSARGPALHQSQPVPQAEHAQTPAVTAANYDKVMIKAIQVRWLQLLDARGYGGGVKGRMVVEFNIRTDGTVSNINVVESNLPPQFAQLCQAAIRDVAPFAPWPNDLREQIGKDERTVRFNFSF
jgi:TonB family protein